MPAKSLLGRTIGKDGVILDYAVELLKCRTEPSSHGGLSGRDNSIKELAEEFSFILKTAGILS